MYNKWDVYLTNNVIIVKDIIEGYTEFLLQGYTIHGDPVVYSTIVGYLRIVNKHYKENKLREPFDPNDDSDVAIVLKKVQEFEKASRKRDPLTDEACAKMLDLMKDENNPLGFRAAVWNFTAWADLLVSDVGSLLWTPSSLPATTSCLMGI